MVHQDKTKYHRPSEDPLKGIDPATIISVEIEKSGLKVMVIDEDTNFDSPEFAKLGKEIRIANSGLKLRQEHG